MRLPCWILCVLLLAGCARSGGQPPRPARINHIVLFKLNKPADAPELLADCDAMLAAIPGVVSVFAGGPIDTGRGKRVDGDYDVAFYVGFDSEEDYLAYVDHPDHVAIVKKWTPQLKWIRMHDAVDDSP